MKHFVKISLIAISLLFATIGKSFAVVANCNLDTNANEHQQYLRLTLSDDSGKTENTVIELNKVAASQFEIDEDLLFHEDNKNANIYSLSRDDVPLAVNVLPLQQTEPTVIPIGIVVRKSCKMKLSMTKCANISSQFKIILVDRYRNKSCILKPNKNYDFTVDKVDGWGYINKRFVLVIYQTPYYTFAPSDFYDIKQSGTAYHEGKIK